MQTLKLPDLDRLEALADAMPEHLQLKGWYVAAPSFGQQHVYADNFKGQGRQHIASLPAHKTYFAGLAEFIAAFDPATVKHLIAIARRAQPEGEAPQADGLTRYSMWSNPAGHGMDPSPSGDWVSFDEVRVLLAAQSQGAQAAMRKCSKFGHRCNCAQDCDPAEPHPSMAAQQAAAPCALDDLLPPLCIRNDRDMLNYLMTAFDNEIANCERCGHAEPTKNMDSASFLRDYLAAAPSAPGTPEAPADIVLDAQRWRALLGSARIKMQGSAGIVTPQPNNYAHFGMEIWTTYSRDFSQEMLDRMDSNTATGREWLTKYADIARAAQLDGGQGEKP